MAGKYTEFVQLVNESFELAAEARKPYEKKWDEYYRLSRGVVGKQPAKWMTNYFVPYIPAITEIVTSRLAARRLTGAVVGENEQSALSEHVFNQLLEQQQYRTGFEQTSMLWVQESIRYGSSFLKLGWKREKAEHLRRTKSFLDRVIAYFRGLGEDMTAEDFLYDGPTIELVDIYDLFFHPQAKSVRDSRFVIHRQEMSKDQILKNPNFAKNLDQVKKMAGSSEQIGEYRKDRLRAAGLTAAQEQRVLASLNDTYLEVLEFRGLFDIDGDGIEEEVVGAIVNREVCVQFEENPYYLLERPVVKLDYKNDPNFLYGISLIDTLKDSQYMLNDIANQSGDMRKLTLQPLKKVKKSANLNLENLKIAPGLPIVLDDVNDLVFERPPDFTNQLEFMSRAVRQVMQIASGINDVTIGVDDAGLASDTLGAVQIAEEQTSLRFRMPALNLDNAMETMTDMLIGLNQQFFDRPKMMRIFDDSGMLRDKKLRPTDLMGKFRFKSEPTSGGAKSQIAERKELVDLKQLFTGDPTKDMAVIDRKIIEAYGQDPSSVVKDASVGNTDTIQKMLGTMNPQQIEQFLGNLKPRDRELMQKAISAASGQPEAIDGQQEGLIPAESTGNTPTN